MDNESLLSTSSKLEPFASDDLGKKTSAVCIMPKTHGMGFLPQSCLLCWAGAGLGWAGLDPVVHLLNTIMFLFLSLSIDFLSASPGNTVIHLDKALARMREYERMKLRAGCNTDNPEHSSGAAAAAAASVLTQGTAVNTLGCRLDPTFCCKCF